MQAYQSLFKIRTARIFLLKAVSGIVLKNYEIKTNRKPAQLASENRLLVVEKGIRQSDYADESHLCPQAKTDVFSK